MEKKKVTNIEIHIDVLFQDCLNSVGVYIYCKMELVI